jgi:hypothetical protein
MESQLLWRVKTSGPRPSATAHQNPTARGHLPPTFLVLSLPLSSPTPRIPLHTPSRRIRSSDPTAAAHPTRSRPLDSSPPRKERSIPLPWSAGRRHDEWPRAAAGGGRARGGGARAVPGCRVLRLPGNARLLLPSGSFTILWWEFIEHLPCMSVLPIAWCLGDFILQIPPRMTAASYRYFSL